MVPIFNLRQEEEDAVIVEPRMIMVFHLLFEHCLY